MKTTEQLDVEQALQLIEHLLLRCGDEGEHLVPRTNERKEGEQGLAQQRLATRKALVAARGLLTVAAGLMAQPEGRTAKEANMQIRSSIDKLKLAARGAYEAGHLLVGVKRESA